MAVIGFGNVKIRLNVEGLSAADWGKISTAKIRFQRPPVGGQVSPVEEIEATFNRSEQYLEADFVFGQIDKGDWTFGAKVFFLAENGAPETFVTSLSTQKINISDGFY